MVFDSVMIPSPPSFSEQILQFGAEKIYTGHSVQIKDLLSIFNISGDRQA